MTCGIEKDEPAPVYVDEDFTFVWSACRTDFPTSLLLTPFAAALRGVINDVETAQNCSTGNTVAYTAPHDPGPDQISLWVLWPGPFMCWHPIYFDVIED